MPLCIARLCSLGHAPCLLLSVILFVTPNPVESDGAAVSRCVLSRRLLWKQMGQLSAGEFCPGVSECRKAGLKPLQLGRGRQDLCRALSSRPRTSSCQAAHPSWPFTKAPSFSLDILNRQPVGFKVFASLDFIQEVCLASDLKRISPPTWTPPTVLSSRPEFL